MNFYLKNPHSTKSPIYLHHRYGFSVKDTSSGKKKNIPLKIYINQTISPNHWDNQTQQANNNCPNSIEINYKILEYKKTLKAVFNKFIQIDKILPTPEQLKEAVYKQIAKEPIQLITTSTNFIHFVKAEIDKEKQKNRSKNTVKMYYQFVSNWEKYAKTSRILYLDVEQLSETHYIGFFNYLSNNGYKVNSILEAKKNLHKFLNIARKKFNISFNHKDVNIGIKEEDVDAIYYNKEEINLIYKLNKLPNHLEIAKDLFVVSCETSLRYCDLNRLQSENLIERKVKGELRKFIRITTQKTGTPVLIPVSDKVVSIFNKYKGFPKSVNNQKFNTYIKEVCSKVKELNIDFIVTHEYNKIKKQKVYKKWQLTTSHTGRRSWCTNMYLIGAPVKSIMAVSGHTTEKSFYKYIKIGKDEHSDILCELMEF
jgi:integrase